MKITFIGATHEVTGSCYYLEAAGKKFLVDCGMEQGPDYYENQDIPVKGSDLDFVLLTHAQKVFRARFMQHRLPATFVTLCFETVPTFRCSRQSGVTVKDAARASRNLFLLTPWKMRWALSRILFRARMKKPSNRQKESAFAL